ncbi:MAG: uroporphyrinogen-III synthase [Burkholderiaceae bacterium]
MILKGEGGRRDWIDRYRAQGVEVDEYNLFASTPVLPDEGSLAQLRGLCERGGSLVLVLSSRQALSGLLAWAPAAPLLDWLRRQPVAAVHPNVEAPCRAAGWQRVTLPRAGQTLGGLALELANGLAGTPGGPPDR